VKIGRVVGKSDVLAFLVQFDDCSFGEDNTMQERLKDAGKADCN
jgi:hypothetical protein